MGQLLRGTRARIVDLGTGQDLGPNQRGELLIKGPLVRGQADIRRALLFMHFYHFISKSCSFFLFNDLLFLIPVVGDVWLLQE